MTFGLHLRASTRMLSESGTSLVKYERNGITSTARVASTKVKPVTSAWQDPLTGTGIPVAVFAGAEVLFGAGIGADVEASTGTGAEVDTGILPSGTETIETVTLPSYGMRTRTWYSIPIVVSKNKRVEVADATHWRVDGLHPPANTAMEFVYA